MRLIIESPPLSRRASNPLLLSARVPSRTADGGESMRFLRRLLSVPEGQPGVDEPGFSVSVSFGTREQDRYEDCEALIVAAVGGVEIPGAIYRDYQRDTQDWSSGIRLEDPETGRQIWSASHLPAVAQEAGAMEIKVAGITHHPDAHRDEFSVGRFVRLVPEPTNPVNAHAIAVRSADGRCLAGYVPEEDLEAVRGSVPTPTVGLVIWENYTWRPRQRRGVRLLIGPSVELRVIPPAERARETARREAVFDAGERAQQERLERERAEREARERQAAEWRAQGLCVDCGAVLEPGKRFVRCASCRSTRRAGAQAKPSAPEPPRTYANTSCPYCGAVLDPLPRAKKACPSCQNPIYVRLGPDGLTYLLQGVDLPTMQAAWDEHVRERGAEDRAALMASALEDGRRTLAECAAAGLAVEILTDDASCDECRKVSGGSFDPRVAPAIPNPACRNGYCRCCYLPVASG